MTTSGALRKSADRVMGCHSAHGNNGHRDWLRQLFDLGVARCQPREVLPALLPTDAPAGRNIVLGAGKAAAEMAAVANACLAGRTTGLVVTRHGHGARSPTGNIRVIEAGHPVPDSQSLEAAAEMLAIADTACAGDRVHFMMSGGGSALLCAPIDGLSFEQKQDITRSLLHSGAAIGEINLVRKFLSRIKGGALAARAASAEQRTYVISDVPGDNPADVASGPSISVSDNVDAAIGVLRRYGCDAPKSVEVAMRGASRQQAPKHPVLIAATARTALDAIMAEVAAKGWNPVLLGEDVVGDASEIGREHAKLALKYRSAGKKVALISGGELTVRVRNDEGRGGPNLEYLASLMLGLGRAEGVEAIACDSDGIDGTENNAGAYLSWTSLERARQAGLDPERLLADNDTWACFAALDDLIVTGPTRTNVNDIRIILVNNSSLP